MIFQKREDYTPSQTLALGSTFNFELVREFHLDNFEIEISFTIASGALMATANADGITGLVKRIQVGVSDGAQNRNVVDITGQGALELELQQVGRLDVDTATQFRANPDDQVVTLRYPVRFCHPQIQDPVSSLFLLPLPRFNANPVVSVQIATQAELDLHATPTFAISGTPTIKLRVVRQQVTRDKWPIYNTELMEQSQTHTATVANYLTELQVPGSYGAILIRDYSTNQARAFIETTGGENKLQMLGTVVRRFQLAGLLARNQRSMISYVGTGVPNNIVGAAMIDFISDKPGVTSPSLGSVLDANMLQASGARVQLFQDITGGATAKRNIITQRIYGPLKALKY